MIIKTVFMSNISSEDMTMDSSPVTATAGPRAAGAAILGDWKGCRERLGLPVFETEIGHFRSGASLPDEIWLFASDQPETVPADLRADDTITLAVAAKRLIIERYGYDESAVKLVGYDSCQLNFDEMLDFYDRFFKKTRLVAGYSEAFYMISMTTGSFQANMGLIISAVSYFGHNCEAVYVSGGVIRKTNLVGKLMDKRYLEISRNLIMHYDYSGLADLVESWNGAPRHVLSLIRACQSAYDFDFGRASGELAEVIERRALDVSAGPAAGKVLQKIRDCCEAQELMLSYQSKQAADKKVPLEKAELDGLFAGYQKLLAMWYQKMRISWRKENYFEFYGMLFGFVENVSKYLVMEVTAIPVLKAYFKDVRDAMRACEGFGEYAAAKGVNFNLEVNNLMFDMFLKYLLEKGRFKERGRVVSNFLNPVSELKTLRNQAVHVFGGSSVDFFEDGKLEKKFGGRNVVEAAGEALKTLKIDPEGVSIFDEMNCMITGELEKASR